MAPHIYEHDNWTDFTWQHHVIDRLFGEVRPLQGKLMGQMDPLGFSTKEETTLTALTLEVVKSSEIEGELLPYDQVRSSIARRLGINTAGLVPSSRRVEGIVQMMLDATQQHDKALTEERLFGWHAALFPTGYSGTCKIEAGKYRTTEMQVVSGALGNEKVHYQAIPAKRVQQEMDGLLHWLNHETDLDPVIKAAVAHFRFIIIHPFDDGNGRIARAITDMLLARAEGSGERFYSMSNSILAERKRYYAVLQSVQHSSGDITEWLAWFLSCLTSAIRSTEPITERIIRKASFWKRYKHTAINERQRLMLNKLMDGFEGKLQTSKWAKITKTSTDTALRDIKGLVEKGILAQADSHGRSVRYMLASN